MRYFEDVEIGARQSFGSRLMSREEVIAFAEAYDPQPFHLSDEAAAATHFGRLAASGWHTCAMTMRMLVDHAAEERQAGLGSPGIDELRWLKPVYPGDVLRCETDVLAKRPSRSRPEMGLVKSRVSVFNQHGDVVMTMVSNVMVATRPAEEPPTRA